MHLDESDVGQPTLISGQCFSEPARQIGWSKEPWPYLSTKEKALQVSVDMRPADLGPAVDARKGLW